MTRFEPWAFAAFAVASAAALLFLYLGMRPGGSGPTLAYRYGVLVLGWAAAFGMLVGLAWSLRRRPVLQRGRAWPLAALAATLWFCSLPIAYPSSHEGKFSPTRFRLPFAGSARVRYGGERRENSLRYDPARRFGLGFEANGAGLEVRAPSPGTLIQRSAGRYGDVLVLETGTSEYCVLDGLAPGAGAPAPGDRVAADEVLGRAGGILFVHLQDRPEPGKGEGIPMRFFGYRADGRAADAGVPIPPQEVAREPREPPARTDR